MAQVEILVDPAGPAGEFVAHPTTALLSYLCGVDGVQPGTSTYGAATVVATARPARAGLNTVRIRVTPLTTTVGSTSQVALHAISLTVMD